MNKRVITNEEFNIELAKSDNVAIMNSACIPFRRQIDQDDLYSIKLMALWNSLKLWRPNGRKFTSFLFSQTRWCCIKFVEEKKRHKMLNVEVDRKVKPYGHFDEMIEQLPENLQDIFIKRFVGGLTLRELAKIYGCCPESARRKILKGLAILRENNQF